MIFILHRLGPELQPLSPEAYHDQIDNAERCFKQAGILLSDNFGVRCDDELIISKTCRTEDPQHTTLNTELPAAITLPLRQSAGLHVLHM